MPELVEYGPLPEPKSKRRERLNEKTENASLRDALAEACHERDQLSDQVERLTSTVASLQEENARLKEENIRLRSEPGAHGED